MVKWFDSLLINIDLFSRSRSLEDAHQKHYKWCESIQDNLFRVIVYDLPGNQPFGVLNAVEAVCEEKGKFYGHGRKSLVYRGISEGIDLRYTKLNFSNLLEGRVQKRYSSLYVNEGRCSTRNLT